jgi:hypothetical protein
LRRLILAWRMVGSTPGKTVACGFTSYKTLARSL